MKKLLALKDSLLNKTKVVLQRLILFFAFIILTIFLSQCSRNESKMEYSISMDNPSTHLFHVTFIYKGFTGNSIDCRLPVWTPGYYWITNFPKNVLNFTVENEEGKPLTWEKTTKNTWRINTENANSIKVKYSIYAFNQSVADPFLDAGRAFISPAGVFMYVDGKLKHPVTIEIIPFLKWKKISTGLDPFPDRANTFYASDFDILYDCPILVGNQEVFTFDVKGIPHHIAMEFPKEFDVPKLAVDLKKIVETSESIIGEIPYKHYTYLIMGEGRGGLEHKNSMAVFSNGTTYNPNDQSGYIRWMSFLAHEYFHLFNIKTIRPIELGPFDYNNENYTNMLWFSEGGTVYYEYIILNRAGLMDRSNFLEEVSDGIRKYEQIPGRYFQSATESSFDTWIKFFSNNENSQNTSISYYDKGFALCMLLDLKIRHETKNKKSLDDVMRALYYDFHKAKNRGFSSIEFQNVVENIAGCSLKEIFDYASSKNDIDYSKYFAYAGLIIDTALVEKPNCWFGAKVLEKNNRLIVSSVELNSPCYTGGISARDTIIEIENVTATKKQLDEILKSKASGDELELLISNRLGRSISTIKLEKKKERSYNITLTEKTDSLQNMILQDLMK